MTHVMHAHGLTCVCVRAAAVGGRTHSQLRARLAELRAAGATADAALLSAFLAAGAGAACLSGAGLTALLAGVPDRQLCVLHRGGAFHAAFKREDSFYLLLTDEPLPGVAGGAVWEELREADGENALIDASFCAVLLPGGEQPARRPRRAGAPAQPEAAALAPAGAGADAGGSGDAAAAAAAAPLHSVGPSDAALASSSAAVLAASAAAGEAGAAARLAAAYAATPGGQAAEAAAALARDHLVALRLQESFEEQERAARKAVRQASSRLQLQQERGAGGEESAEVRALMTRIEERMGERCAIQ